MSVLLSNVPFGQFLFQMAYQYIQMDTINSHWWYLKNFMEFLQQGFFQHDVTEYVILVLTNFSTHRHIQKDNLTAWKFLPDYLYLCKIFLSRLAHLLMNLQQ